MDSPWHDPNSLIPITPPLAWQTAASVSGADCHPSENSRRAPLINWLPRDVTRQGTPAPARQRCKQSVPKIAYRRYDR